MPGRKENVGFLEVSVRVELSVADSHQSSLYMRVLAIRFPSARFQAKVARLSITRR